MRASMKYMDNKQKILLISLLIALLFVVIVAGGYYALNTKKVVPEAAPQTSSSTSQKTDPNLKSYIGSDFSFNYPAALHTLQDNETVTITHSIPYKHTNACDFKGDAPPLDVLTDFTASIKVVNQSVKEYLEKSGSPDWEYVSKNLYTFGSFTGYHVTLGAEGCGQDVYYFSISPGKTVVVTRALIAEFSPINGEYQKYLSLPGVILPAASEVYFEQILSSLTIK